MTQAIPPFHLAFPVRDLAEARRFYGELLGCPEGRSSPNGSISISMATRSWLTWPLASAARMPPMP